MNVKQNLLVCGCSVTQGCETVDGFMHPDNVKHSYSYHVANHLNLELVNTALSGGSNDWIFFSTMENIQKLNNIHSVIVAWTIPERLIWKCKNRFWMFTGSWCTSISDKFPSWKRNVEHDNVWFNTDDPEYIDLLKQNHKFFVDNYLDDSEELAKKLKAYSIALESVCKQKNIKLVQIKAFDTVPLYLPSIDLHIDRHPTADEHKRIAEKLLNQFYL